ncbi:MAG: enoyl-CoA hydratase/isomerase family protein [Alicyclobacillus macrosporangiidus]|uniref:enoyl-CoA hydratase-related protein n=1 Tax=Alicyclobacillus macrosporangiidus TaxID=392015 RepID=UPI0026E9F0A3|nr:enoyl-CoA hydratase-related protein [Alicyclobacillus macrosporangiidus]MCL6597869.1 enoyl-CoA hydratase/isomerase family protein [Alicyclobacillus macrosporangiidus]
MEYQEILYQVDGAVATITLNRPEALNALTRTMRRELLDALERVAQDRQIRALLITGAGRAFCVGQDVRELADYYEQNGPELGRVVDEEYIPIVRRLRSLPKPCVVLVNGAAVGGGLALVLAADFRILHTKSNLSPVFVKVGLAPDTAVSFLLSRAIGHARATSLTLRGGTLTPEEAVACGLAAKVNSSMEEAWEEAHALLAELSAGPTRAYAEIRRLYDLAAAHSLEETLQFEREAQDRLAHTGDHQEAVAAFLEKRQPKFSGQ